MIRNVAKRMVNFLLRTKLNMTKNYYIESNVKLLHSQLDRYVSIAKGCNVMWSKIGKYTYLGGNTELPYCKIGNYCSIAPHVMLAEGLHPMEFISSHPLMYGGMGYRMRGGYTYPINLISKSILG